MQTVAHKDDTGKVNYYSTIARDISQQKQAELELRIHRDNLEQLVAERTKALEHSNKELEAYSYSIAHDLRLPLRTIVSFGQILLDDTANKLNDEELDQLNRLVKAGKHMSNLIDDILNLAQISRIELHPKTVNISNIAHEIAERLQKTDTNRQASWNIQEHIESVGDPNLLYIAMDNLIGNAWKYSSRSQKTIIEIGKTTAENEITFYVKDHGAGFEMAYANKLFNPFQRLHGQEYEGTGIGLATVARIIHRHGGRIWAQSQVNQGATFYFTLPGYCEVKTLEQNLH